MTQFFLLVFLSGTSQANGPTAIGPFASRELCEAADPKVVAEFKSLVPLPYRPNGKFTCVELAVK